MSLVKKLDIELQLFSFNHISKIVLKFIKERYWLRFFWKFRKKYSFPAARLHPHGSAEKSRSCLAFDRSLLLLFLSKTFQSNKTFIALQTCVVEQLLVLSLITISQLPVHIHTVSRWEIKKLFGVWPIPVAIFSQQNIQIKQNFQLWLLCKRVDLQPFFT